MIDESQLAALPVDAKLQLVTTLWDQIALSETPITLRDEVLEDAQCRLDEMRNDLSASLTDEDMWRRADELR